MILECPACSNRYLVDRRAVGATGRNVRCAKCKNEWFARPPQDEAALAAAIVEQALEPQNPEVKPIPAGSSVPVVTPVKRKRSWKMAGAIAASLLLFTLVAGIYFRPLIIAALPAAAKAYDLVGMYDTRGIVMAELAYHKNPVQLKDKHRVTGYLVNTTKEPRRLPTVNIMLLGKEDIVLRHRKLEETAEMKPGESKEFAQEIETSPDSVERIVVEFGNPLELKLR